MSKFCDCTAEEEKNRVEPNTEQIHCSSIKILCFHITFQQNGW